uniref:Uncharacterized protein n=1 Tax=Globodera rostochiensis TaxID=31243 RepID=A0A914GWW0_GLORO
MCEKRPSLEGLLSHNEGLTSSGSDKNGMLIFRPDLFRLSFFFCMRLRAHIFVHRQREKLLCLPSIAALRPELLKEK